MNLFYTFLESIVTENNVDTLIPIMEGYCIINGIENNVLTEASFNEFARKHGGKVKAFMAGLMLLASVANAGTSNTKVNVDDGGHSYSGKAQTQMTSGGDGDAEGNADAQKLLKLLKSDNVDNNELHKHFDSMKSHAKDPGYMKALNKVMNGAGIDTSKIFGDNDSAHKAPVQHSGNDALKNLVNELKNTESNDEQAAINMGNDTLRASGVTGHSIVAKQLPNGNYVAVLSK